MVTLRCIWGFVLLALLSTGCAPGVVAAAPIAPSPCPPETASWNPYNNPINGRARYIYDHLLEIPNSQQEAFGLLVYEVRTWTDHVDLLVEDNLAVRITVTFISRELIEALMLNQILAGSNVANLDFNSNVQFALEDVARRNELLFLVTITPSKYEERLLPDHKLMIHIPVDQMWLTNSGNLSVLPSHRDSFLVNQIDLRSEPAHGYVAYPVSVETDGGCYMVIDPLWDTSLSLHVSDLQINQADQGQRTWNMDYHPLVESSNANATSPAAEGSYLLTPGAPCAAPTVNGETFTTDNTYWSGMSRFISCHLLNLLYDQP